MGKGTDLGWVEKDHPMFKEGFTAFSPRRLRGYTESLPENTAGMTPDDSQTTDESSTPNEGMDDEMMQAANKALKASEWQMYHAHEKENTPPAAEKSPDTTQTTDPQDSNPNVDSGD